jgi:precorrin-6Y C5,15-methyltransferase (decarboxylating)
VSRIVELAFDKLRRGGRLVANVGSVENLAAVRDVLQKKSGDCQVWMINISCGTDQMDRLRFEAMNPTFLVGAKKK